MSLWQMWGRLDPDTKDKIIDLIVEAYSAVFRKAYRDTRKKPQ